MSSSTAKKLILCVVDGLPASLLESELSAGSLPNLAGLAEHAEYGRGTSVFPSVTPVCLSSIATGENVARHGIPHIAWFDRDEGRVVDYGSSTRAVLAAGPMQVWRDSMVEMTRTHLSREVDTIFESLERQRLVTATVTFTCFRGPVPHEIRFPRFLRRGRWFETVHAPSKFFFFNLFESDPITTPLALRSRGSGSVDAYGAAVAAHLVADDAFDFFLFYMPDLDYSAHLTGDEGARTALRRVDGHLGSLFAAAGGLDAFLDRYAIVVTSDHGYSGVHGSVRLEDLLSDLRVLGSGGTRVPEEGDVAVCASMRVGAVYRLAGCREDARGLAARLERSAAIDLTLFKEGDEAVARRDGEELRFRPNGASASTNGDAWSCSGSNDVLDRARYPDGLSRVWHALSARRSGDVLVSAADGWEFLDLAGRDHVGGAAHGSLAAGDSLVPVLSAGVALPTEGALSITDLAPLARAHFADQHLPFVA
ncbi:MAG: alkaline phosphatase family protein [Gaiellaceae bacterium]